MKSSVFYQLVTLMASVTAVAAAEPAPFVEPFAEPLAEPLAEAVRRSPEERALYDASGAHLLADLERRSANDLHKRNGWLHCGTFPDADRGNANDQINQLGTGDYIVPARRCLRVKCWNTTGTYVCNDQRVDLHVSGTAIKQRAQIIMSKCCDNRSAGGGEKLWQISGQQFTDAQGGYNVILAYSNCNHDKFQAPDTYIGGVGSKCDRGSAYIT